MSSASVGSPAPSRQLPSTLVMSVPLRSVPTRSLVVQASKRDSADASPMSRSCMPPDTCRGPRGRGPQASCRAGRRVRPGRRPPGRHRHRPRPRSPAPPRLAPSSTTVCLPCTTCRNLAALGTRPMGGSVAGRVGLGPAELAGGLVAGARDPCWRGGRSAPTARITPPAVTAPGGPQELQRGPGAPFDGALQLAPCGGRSQRRPT
jgi:hypothetical protein